MFVEKVAGVMFTTVQSRASASSPDEESRAKSINARSWFVVVCYINRLHYLHLLMLIIKRPQTVLRCGTFPF